MIVDSALCGTLGGVVLAGNQGRTAVRSRTPRRRGLTRRQQTIARLFAAANYRWSLVLTDGDKASWEAYAAALAEVTGGCDPRSLTGKDLFVGYWVAQQWAVVELASSLGPVDAGPGSVGRPPGPSALTTLEEGGPGLLWGGTLSAAAAALGVVLWYVYRPLPRGVGWPGNPWHLAASAGVTVGGTGFSSVSQFEPRVNWSADWVIGAGDRVRWKLRALYSDGRFSLPLFGQSVVGA